MRELCIGREHKPVDRADYSRKTNTSFKPRPYGGNGDLIKPGGLPTRRTFWCYPSRVWGLFRIWGSGFRASCGYEGWVKRSQKLRRLWQLQPSERSSDNINGVTRATSRSIGPHPWPWQCFHPTQILRALTLIRSKLLLPSLSKRGLFLQNDHNICYHTTTLSYL